MSGFFGPNLLVLAGVLPFLVWTTAVVANSFRFPPGLSDLMFAGAIAFATYVFSIVISGLGALWANDRAKALQVRMPLSTRVCINLVALILLAPWLLLVGSVIVRSVR